MSILFIIVHVAVKIKHFCEKSSFPAHAAGRAFAGKRGRYGDGNGI